MLQKILEKPLEKKAGKNYGPPGSKKMVYFLDDMNMPEVDTYGTVQPHTLIRQHLDYNHWYAMVQIFVMPSRGQCFYLYVTFSCIEHYNLRPSSDGTSSRNICICHLSIKNYIHFEKHVQKYFFNAVFCTLLFSLILLCLGMIETSSLWRTSTTVSTWLVWTPPLAASPSIPGCNVTLSPLPSHFLVMIHSSLFTIPF